jgi:hypothetical protein
MSSLRNLQSLHVRLTAKLIDWAYAQGYELTWGQTLRTQADANANAASGAGIKNSLHLIKLAVDLSLFKDGTLLTGVEPYRPLGEFWKSLDPLCTWGGDFKPSPDSDHFSITYEGVK